MLYFSWKVDRMLIKGIQKVTLLDYPGKIACTLFTGGCNLRCPFCQNASLVTHLDEEKMHEEEVLAFLESRVGKLDAVCISGGEPCLQKDLKDFCLKVKQMGFLIKLDTNGCFPEKIKELLDEKVVDYIAMDIKNCPEKYALTAGVKIDLKRIQESVKLIQTSGLSHEFRTTVVQEFHTIQDICKIASWVSPSSLYLQQFKDSGDLIGEGLHAVSLEVLEQMRDKALQETDSVFLRGV